MMPNQKQADSRFSWIRCIYLTVYVVVYALAYSIQLLSSALNVFYALYYLMAAVGGGLLIADLLRRRILFQSKYCSLLVAFVVALAISTISNMRYGVLGNIQAMVWFVIHFFVLAAADSQTPAEVHVKQLRIVMNAFGVVWFVLVVWSLAQYVTQYFSLVYDVQSGWSRRVGFTESRLFGTFSDPNYASVTSAAAIAFAVFNRITKPADVPLKIFSWAQIVVQLLYIVLAASRTVQMGLLLVLVFLAVLYGWKFAEKRSRNKAARIGIVLAGAVLAVALAVGLYKLVQFGLAYVPWLFGYASGRLGMDRPDVVDSSDFSNNRLRIYISYIELFKNKPWFGLSPRNAIAYAQEYFPDSYIATTGKLVHSGYLGLFSYTGIIGGGLMLCWLVLVLAETAGYLFRRRNSGDAQYHVVLVMAMFLIVGAVSALPQLTLFYSNRIHDVLFWITLGYVRVFIRMSEPERYEKMPLPYRAAERVKAYVLKGKSAQE